MVNSTNGGENIGYPSQSAEIDWVAQMMKKAAPDMSEVDQKVIQTALRGFKKT